jgi:polyphosphate kinase
LLKFQEHISGGAELHSARPLSINIFLIYFRVCDRLSSISSTRNADLTVSEDVDDLAAALKGELSSRRFGQAVRLEVEKNVLKKLLIIY